MAPGEDEAWHRSWLESRLNWWEAQGVPKEALTVYEVPPEELAHYSKATYDLMYRFPHGVEELEGIANRTDFDLGAHSKDVSELGLSAQVEENPDSTAKLAIRDAVSGEWRVPYVIEPSAGVDRGVLAVMNEAFAEQELDNGNQAHPVAP